MGIGEIAETLPLGVLNHLGLPGIFPGGNNPTKTGAAEANMLGYNYFGDSVYRLAFPFAHSWLNPRPTSPRPFPRPVPRPQGGGNRRVTGSDTILN